MGSLRSSQDGIEGVIFIIVVKCAILMVQNLVSIGQENDE